NGYLRVGIGECGHQTVGLSYCAHWSLDLIPNESLIRSECSLHMSASRLVVEHHVLVLSPTRLSLFDRLETSRTVHRYSYASSSPCPGIHGQGPDSS
ncbi:unnamed protein product, partial [Prunus brigantina]